jgi:hypothetical protein
MKYLFYIFIALQIISGCNNTTLTGYNFKTTASYTANNSKFNINLNSTGNVPKGMDLGSGAAKGIITFTDSRDTILFITKGDKLTELRYNLNIFEISDSLNFTNNFTELFIKFGRNCYDTNELKEAESVIKSASYGPKATFMEGQTKFLKVNKVEFER